MTPAVNSSSQPAQTAASPASSQRSALTSDFDTFLKMLTAQARNQDPLKPLESSEYASQLAQFSMVEQQVQTNDLLSNVAMALGADRLEQMSNWVGTDVQAATEFRFDGEPVAIETIAEPNADRAELVIQNATGAEVARIPVPTNEAEFSWTGAGGAGGALPHGTYSATLVSYNGRDILASNPAAAYSQVVEVQMRGDQVTLILDSGATVPADSIRNIRKGA